MKKTLTIDKDGKIIFEGSAINKTDVNSTFLEMIFSESLKQQIEFYIDNTDPISLLFQRIKEETEIGTDFSNKVKSLRTEFIKVQEEKVHIEKAEVEDDLPF